MINIAMSTAAVIIDNDVFFSALNFNALLKMNLMSGKTEYVCKFEKEVEMQRLHVSAFSYGKQIWFIPLFGEFIARYDADKGKMEYFDVPRKIVGKLGTDIFWLPTCKGEARPQFFDAGKIDDRKLYLVPATSDAVIILDMETGDISSFYGIVDVAHELMGAGALCDNKLWLAPYIGNHLISLDIRNGSIERIECDYELGHYYGMCSYDNKLWFSPHNINYILVYDTVNRRYEKLNFENKDAKGSSQTAGVLYRDIISYDGKIWVYPSDSETIICIDPLNGQISGLYPPNGHHFGIMVEIDSNRESIFTLSYTYSYIMRIDGIDDLTIFERTRIDDHEFYKLCSDNLLIEFCDQFNGIIPEEQLGLFNYIKAIKKK